MKKNNIISIWNKSFEIGIEEIDIQHRYFLELLRRVSLLDLNSQDDTTIYRYIDELILYARYHFMSEENIMLERKYSDFKNHQKLHLQLLNNLSDQITLLKLQKRELSDVLHFIDDWFKYHTTIEDSKIK